MTRKDIQKYALLCWRSTPMALVCNLALLYPLYLVCRIIFVMLNWHLFNDSFTASATWNFFCGGLRFDTSAIFYTNMLFIFLFILPLHWKERRWWWLTTKIVYIAVNALCMLINLADSVFFEFRGNRSTADVFREFSGEGNLASIAGREILAHWYLVILFGLMIWAMAALYRRPAPVRRPLWKYYVNHTVTLIAAGLITVWGIRGHLEFLSTERPLRANIAFDYTNNTKETGIVLNTPFTIIRTLGKTVIPTPQYFTEEELAMIYSPVHQPSADAPGRGKNLVILILESFGQEYTGALNRQLDGGTYEGYTPYFDAMLDSCMYFTDMFSNTQISIDASPAVLASIPRASRSFVVGTHATNEINSLATELDAMGYRTLFFHGGDNESLGIRAFTRQAGVKEYFGKTEFLADGRFGGKEQYDGTWGIWDEPFLQFFCTKLSETPQPFMATAFTLSSHHPFKVPAKYASRFVDKGLYEMHKCISYADFAVHRFFEQARRQPWYRNTIFVIVADHTAIQITHDEYKTDLGAFRVPILIYDPSGQLPRGRQDGLAQQIDIMPTMLGYLGAARPYIAFGQDLLATDPADRAAFNWVHIPQYIKGDYLLQFNEETSTPMALYNFRTDPLLKHNLLQEEPERVAEMERGIKAVIQSYLSIMNDNKATCR